MKVSIIIPSWNGQFLLEKHLPKVLKAKANKENNILEIVIVDDHSTDETVKYLKKHFKDKVRLIKHSKNRGFSSTVNTGVRMAKGDLVCLLNQDVSPSENFLAKALSHFKDDLVFAVTLHEKGCGPAVGVFENGYIEHKNAKEANSAQDSFWASGGSAVFRRSIWMKLKGFNETLFSPFYWEDVDLAYRAQKRGFKILWEPDSLVSHQHESTINPSNFRARYLNIIKERNQLLLIWKNITSPRLTRKHVASMLKRALHNPGYFIVIFAALRKLFVVRKLRLIEKKESKVSDEAIFAKFS